MVLAFRKIAGGAPYFPLGRVRIAAFDPTLKGPEFPEAFR
jgi:hypothetical protein